MQEPFNILLTAETQRAQRLDWFYMHEKIPGILQNDISMNDSNYKHIVFLCALCVSAVKTNV